MKNTARILFAITVLISTPAFAVKEYYSLTRSTRALGMGGAIYGLSDDEYALFYNPAGLGFFPHESGELGFNVGAEVAGSTFSSMSNLSSTFGSSDTSVSTIVDNFASAQGKPLYARIAPPYPYYVRKNFGIGLLIADTKLDLAFLGKDFASSIDVTAITDTALVIGYAHRFMENQLSVGANLKGVVRAGGQLSKEAIAMANNEGLRITAEEIGGAGAGVDFDLGAQYNIPQQYNIPGSLQSRVSLSFNNVVGSKFPIKITNTGTPPALTRMASIGYYTIFPGWNVIDNVRLVVDYAEVGLFGGPSDDLGGRGGSMWKHLNFGAEAPLFNGGWLVPRLGFYRGYLSAGLGINLRFLRIEFATYSEELSSTPGRFGNRRYAITIALGDSGEHLDPVTAESLSAKPTPPASETKPVEEKSQEKLEEKTPTPRQEEKPKTPRKPQGEEGTTEGENAE